MPASGRHRAHRSQFSLAPPAPTNSWVSLEGEELELELIPKHGAQPPASPCWHHCGTPPACKSAWKTHSDRNQALTLRWGMTLQGEPRGLFLDVPVGDKRNPTDEHIFPACSLRDHPFCPSKRYTASIFRTGTTTQLSKAQTATFPRLAEVMPPQEGHHRAGAGTAQCGDRHTSHP